MAKLSMLAVGLGFSLLTSPGIAADTCEDCPGRVWFVDAGNKAPVKDGTSWATAFANLHQGLNAASSGDCIWVARGRYWTTGGTNRNKAFLIDRSLRVYGGFAGYERCLGQRAGFFKETRLSGEIGLPGPADNAYNVVRIGGILPPGESFDVVLDGFNISDANNDFGLGEGGGVYAQLVKELRIENCIFRRNQADLGAGLFLAGAGVDLVRCEFVANSARKDGGGLYASGIVSVAEPGLGAQIYNVAFRNNAAKRHGGGFFCASAPGGDPVRFVNGLFTGNSAGAGGAGYVAEVDPAPLGFKYPGLVRLVNATVSDNSATVTGSAFAIEELTVLPAELYIENSIIWNNTGTASAIAVLPTGGSYITWSLLQSGSPFVCLPGPGCSVVPNCHSFICDPQFGAGYHLLPGSPGIDSGFPLLPPDIFDLDGDADRTEPVPLDLDEQPRLVGSYDRGCFEAP